MRLRSPLRDVGVGREGLEICCQGTDSVLELIGQGGCGGGAGVLVLARGLQGP